MIAAFVLIKKKDIVRKELSEFSWYINDNEATTVSAKPCAYDRILVTGGKFKKAIIKASNKTYRYDKEFKMDIDEVLF